MQNSAIFKGFGWTRAAAVAVAVTSFAACGGEEGGRGVNGGSGNGTGTGTGSSPGNGDGTGGVSLDPGGGGTPSDGRDLPVREKVCDANGENCTCLRLALLGTLESAADATDTQPFIDWLNGNSDGTATVTMVNTKPVLDATWLAQYDILLVANVNAWSFSDAEKAAVETWVRETGGGIVALTGFVSTDAEPAATSQLLSFAGIQYAPPATATPPGAEAAPVYYKGGTTNLKNCLVWSASVGSPQITAPVKFMPQAGELEKLTFSLDYVGAFYGWTVSGPADATVVANDPVTGNAIALAREVDGTGRVFAFGDEWVIFANQWQPQGNPNDQTAAAHNPCWVAPEGDAPAFFHSIATLYQTKQFWYNVINWVAPPNECNFVVNDDDVVVR